MINRHCWCSDSRLETFSSKYSICTTCQTLISQTGLSAEEALVKDDSKDFYGKEYWLSHQNKDLGFPDIYQRARLDLPERCLYWLRTVLKYRLPSAKILELGSAHGGFVAMLNLAGYEAAGLDLSPWIVEFARKTFAVPMLLGPLEEQPIEPGSLDAIVLMDVFEHLPDPLNTMRRCLECLKPDGILVIQTPCYPINKTHEQMIAESNRFLEMLQEVEHLYLFSQQSVQKFFRQLGANYIQFEPAIFAHYDMCLVVSREPLKTNSKEQIENALSNFPNGRMMQALLDIDSRLKESDADRAARLDQINTLTQLLKESETDRAARLTQIYILTQQLKKLEADKTIQEDEIIKLRTKQKFAAAALQSLKKTRGYRLIRKLKFSDFLVQRIRHFSKRISKSLLSREIPEKSNKTLKRIAIDLTPLSPGGENGGAKLMTVELIRHMSKLAPTIEFFLLTPTRCHDELAYLDSINVRRICVEEEKTSSPQKQNSFLKKVNADLLFCPFTAPFFYEPNVPVVSVVYDLQYRYYPQFFNADELHYRNIHFMEACRLASRLICISEYVRKTIIENAEIDPERVETAYIRLPTRLETPSLEKADIILNRFNLKKNQFIFYPANFWAHKNHLMLLTAFGMYRAAHPTSDLKLVCTGAPGSRMEQLQEAACKMKLNDWVIFPGYVSNEELACLITACRAVIFPSLYEGFGMPILEAMALGKPVLCSNVTSLPEVAGDAALFFDPRKPTEIVNAISRIENEPMLPFTLIERGYDRLKTFGGPQEMATQYLQIFQKAINDERKFSQALYGVYHDGWTSDRLIITHDSSTEKRYLELELALPDAVPTKQINIKLFDGVNTRAINHRVNAGQSIKLRQKLPRKNGFIEIYLDPLFQPKASGTGEDIRILGCKCNTCQIISPKNVTKLFVPSQ